MAPEGINWLFCAFVLLLKSESELCRFGAEMKTSGDKRFSDFSLIHGEVESNTKLELFQFQGATWIR